MPTKTWKDVERRVAKKFGTHRTPLSGENSRHTKSDTLHKKFFIEVKYRKKIPFFKTFRETIELAKKENKTPLVIFKEKNSRYEIVMMRLKDFLRG
jgi:glutamate mutase epsilon subunit